jgi:hypothetical protein
MKLATFGCGHYRLHIQGDFEQDNVAMCGSLDNDSVLGCLTTIAQYP